MDCAKFGLEPDIFMLLGSVFTYSTTLKINLVKVSSLTELEPEPKLIPPLSWKMAIKASRPFNYIDVMGKWSSLELEQAQIF